MRREIREQLDTLGEDEFVAQFPPWDQLSAEVQETKVRIARDELLRVLDRAGYQVRKKKEITP